jgi:hypothetical protein
MVCARLVRGTLGQAGRRREENFVVLTNGFLKPAA